MELREVDFAVSYTLEADLIALSALCAVICTIGVVGNAFVVLLFITNRKLRTVTNALVLNLSVYDFGLSLFSAIILWANVVSEKWALGYIGCQVNGLINILFCGGSLLGLVGYERYLVIVKHTPMTPRKALLAVSCAWCYCLCLSSFPYWFGDRYVLSSSGIYCGGCTLAFAWSLYGSHSRASMNLGDWSNRTPTVIIFSILCLMTVSVPMKFFAVMYYHILSTARENTRCWAAREGTDSTDVDPKERLAQVLEARIARKAAILVLVFVVNWLLYDVQFMWELTVGHQAEKRLCQLSILGCYLNSACNPILFITLDAKWKSAAYSILGIKWERRNSVLGQDKGAKRTELRATYSVRETLEL
ncbi:hypothetical protein SpCBS45565_g05236 [Spizellomyces sp. 'palustris']|nr:hypothetical protein SpCBS45565_g05236 [Spizellomyces sp. 'palustris']